MFLSRFSLEGLCVSYTTDCWQSISVDVGILVVYTEYDPVHHLMIDQMTTPSHSRFVVQFTCAKIFPRGKLVVHYSRIRVESMSLQFLVFIFIWSCFSLTLLFHLLLHRWNNCECLYNERASGFGRLMLHGLHWGARGTCGGK